MNPKICRIEKAYFALHNFFKSKLFFRGTEVGLYMTIIGPTVTYGNEIWPTTI